MLLENIEIWLLGSFLGVLDLILDQFWSKNAKNLLNGLESQMRPFFHTVRGTEYEFCLKLSKHRTKGSFLATLGPILDQKLYKRLRVENEALNPHSFCY